MVCCGQKFDSVNWVSVCKQVPFPCPLNFIPKKCTNCCRLWHLFSDRHLQGFSKSQLHSVSVSYCTESCKLNML